jgi:hypothetical protein
MFLNVRRINSINRSDWNLLKIDTLNIDLDVLL